jgi:murein DD-endopeptidase MepM/ murein hydrolase activator NlpD
MNISGYKEYRRNGFSRAATAFFLFLVLLITGFFAYQIFIVHQPIINGAEALHFLSAANTVTLHGEHIRSAEVSIIQGSRKIDLLKDTEGGREKTYTFQIRPKDLALSDGAAVVAIRAEAGMFKKLKQDIKVLVDTVPPSLEVLKVPETVTQGGTGFAVLRAKGADSVSVKLEDKMFPAFRRNAGTDGKSELSPNDGAADYYVFFPLPFDVKGSAVLHAVAKDAAGNQNVLSFHTLIKTVPYRSSVINIDDTFIDTVASSMLNETNISDHEGAFKKVNEELRAKALEKLTDISKQTSPKILWKGAFLQLKNSKVMAMYGDKRAYIYKGKVVSHSVHLGYDLASNAHAQVEAANSGIVRFAGDLSIYGNTVIIDHGMGLMSLYGHMSVINVSEGQAVNKGDIIGRTGSTGLAGGDHLHFGMLVHGYEVSPLFWWDPHWIQVNEMDAFAG